MKHYWGWPLNSRKSHIFPGAGTETSLCGKWMFQAGDGQPAETGRTAGRDDCKECVKRLNASAKVGK